ncbi:MAG: hypothetical protein ABIF04_02195 [Chloroflexota bacterium]
MSKNFLDFLKRWWLLILLAVFPLSYFVYRFCDTSFRDNAIGNWFATVMGVFVGIPIAIEISLRQQAQHVKEEKDKKQKELQTQFSILFDRVDDELDENETHLEYLGEVLSKSKNAREDLWNWAITIVDSFSFSSYENLHSSGLDKLLPENLEVRLYLSYLNIRTLLHGVIQSAAAHKYLYKSTNRKPANEILKATVDKREQVAKLVDETAELIADFRAEGMKIKESLSN